MRKITVQVSHARRAGSWRATRCAAALVLWTAAPGLAQDVPSQVAVFRTEADLVTVDVSVVDGTGRPARGLTADDFVLKVDGEPRNIATLEFVNQSAASGPLPSTQFATNEGAVGGRLIMLVVDQGNIRQGGGQTFIRAAERLLADLGPGDRIGLAVIPAGRVVDFTSHIELVRQALSRLMGGAQRFVRSGSNRVGTSEALAISRGEAQVLRDVVDRECTSLARPTVASGASPAQECASEVQDEAHQLAAHALQQTGASLTALRQILIRMAASSQPKTLVLLSEGMFLGRGLEDVSWISSLASRARASLYAIHIDDAFAEINTSVARASTSQFEDRRLRLDGLHTIVGMARGSVFSSMAGGDAAFARLSLELTGYYLLGFEPRPGERDGRSHEISVQVKRRGLDVRARREFVLAAGSGAARSDEEVLAGVLRDPLLAADVRLRLAAYSFPESGGRIRVLLSAGLGSPADVRPVRSVAFALTDDRGQVVSSRIDSAGEPSEDPRYQTTVPVEPGWYTVRLAGVDAAGRRGSVEHRFKAALTTAGALAVGDLMLSDAHATGDGRLRPAIEPEIHSDGFVAYSEVSSSDGAQLAAATARLEIARGANDPALASADLSVTGTRHADRRAVEGDVSLAEIEAGDYVARLVVSVSGRPIARVLRSFTYDPRRALPAAPLTDRRLPSSARPGAAAFSRTDVLQPGVVEFFLARAAVLPPAGAAAPELQGAWEAVHEGRFVELPDALSARAGEADARVAFLRGLGFFARGELEPAAAEFRRTLALDDEMVAATFYLGACYAAGGRDKEAVGAWQTTLAAAVEAPFVYAFAADAYLRMQDTDAAVDLIREGMDEWPEDAGLQGRLVRAYVQANRSAEALAALDRHVDRWRGDHDMLLLGMRLVYEAHVGGRPLESPEADLARFRRYLAAYVAIAGPERALAEQWLAAVGSARP
jgi:VWFA-related protein